MKKSSSNVLYIEDILAVLPHRYPFVLIDRVLSRSGLDSSSRLGQKVVALKNITYNEPYFTGHFPHKPVMPGVLILEAMAQAGAMACHRADDPDMDVAIGRIGEARIRRPVVPGDQLIIEAEVKKDRGEMVVISAKASVDQDLVTEVEILAYITKRK